MNVYYNKLHIIALEIERNYSCLSGQVSLISSSNYIENDW